MENLLWAGIAIMGAALGAGLVTIGVGLGIGRIGGPASEAVARQPEASGDIRGNMIITAAMIEGVALFAAVICLLGVIFTNGYLGTLVETITS